MPIIGKSLTQIRDDLLSAMQTHLGAIGYVVDIRPGTYHFRLARRLAVHLLEVHGRAQDLAAEIDPRTMSLETLLRLTDLLDVNRGDGTKGRYTVTFTGSAELTSVDLTGRYFLRNGLRYDPVENSVAMTSGSGTCTIEATDVGTLFALKSGDRLKWGSAPAGLDPTAVFSSEVTEARDSPSDELLREQVIAELRARPSSGNPQHVINMAEAHEDVAEAYCYCIIGPHASGPSAASTFTDDRLDKPGSATVLMMGPPQGDKGLGSAMTHSRSRSVAQAQGVREYFLGIRNPDGTLKRPRGSQLFFAGMDPDDWSVTWPNINAFDVELAITPTYSNEPTWTGSHAVSAATQTTVTVNGDHTDLEGLDALVYVGAGRARGGWVKRNLKSANYASSVTAFTLDEALPERFSLSDPWANGDLLPAMGNWTDIRDALFEFFDGLGPGDIPTPAETAYRMRSIKRRMRYPSTTWKGQTDVALSDLRSATIGAGGVLDVSVVTPLVNKAASPFELFALNELKITRA